MKYFFLVEDTKQMGNFPQAVVKNIYSDDEYPSGSVFLMNNDCFPDFLPSSNFNLRNRAKLTDFLSVIAMPKFTKLISVKVKEILSDFNIVENAYFDTIVYDKKGNSIGYYIFHGVNSRFDGLNVVESKFNRLADDYVTLLDISFDSFEDFEKNTYDRLYFSKIVIDKKSIFAQKDMFFFPMYHSEFIFSERLVEALLKQKVTGVRFEEANIVLA